MRRALPSDSWDNIETVAAPLPYLPRTARIVSFGDDSDPEPEPDYDDAETVDLRKGAFRPPSAPQAIEPILGKTRSVPAMKAYAAKRMSSAPTPPMAAAMPAPKPQGGQDEESDRPKIVSLGASYGVQGVWLVVVAVTLLAFMKIIPAAFARFDSIASTIHTTK